MRRLRLFPTHRTREFFSFDEKGRPREEVTRTMYILGEFSDEEYEIACATMGEQLPLPKK